MLDYCSIPPEKEWIKEHKVCSIKGGILKLMMAVLECALLDIKCFYHIDQVITWMNKSGDDYLFHFAQFVGYYRLTPAGSGGPLRVTLPKIHQN